MAAEAENRLSMRVSPSRRLSCLFEEALSVDVEALSVAVEALSAAVGGAVGRAFLCCRAASVVGFCLFVFLIVVVRFFPCCRSVLPLLTFWFFLIAKLIKNSRICKKNRGKMSVGTAVFVFVFAVALLRLFDGSLVSRLMV